MKKSLVFRGALIVVPLLIMFFSVYFDLTVEEWTLMTFVQIFCLSIFQGFAVTTGTLFLVQLLLHRKVENIQGFEVIFVIFISVIGAYVGMIYVFFWLYKTFWKKDPEFI